ncbi:MAG: phosphotransferase [Dehalococcoidia bacterium]
MELEDLAAILGVPVEAITGAETIEPGILRVSIEQGGGHREVLVRGAASAAAQTHAAVLDALARVGFAPVPRVLAFSGGLMAETAFEGLTALAVVPPATALEEAVDTIADLHQLPVGDKVRWELEQHLVPGAELPLHRLGFAAHEREPALRLLESARETLAAGPFGFVHGELHSGNVVFTAGGSRLVEFGAAAQGHQLIDIAAFLATAGLEPPLRRDLAERYARRRAFDLAVTADAIDLATIPWGLAWLVELPRRQVLALGDDAATERISVLAARTHDALRRPAGHDPIAAALRAALWP